MLYNFQRKKLCSHLLVGGALFVGAFGMYSCSDKYDLDTEQPSNLNSIYGYMKEQGNFNTCLRLIDDLGETEVLSKTGSKTMFIANDEAFAKFFSTNSWNVNKYEELTLAQKKLLLYSAMIDNPYSTSMLSTAEGPTKGEVCRRSSSLTIYDSVLVVNPHSAKADEILPKNSRFDEIRAGRDTVVLFTDASNSAPMVHFNYKFVASNKLQNTDIDFLYGDPDGTRKNDDVYVNNSKVILPNIFCKNGFIHQVDKVVMPLDNMAEIIRKDPETSEYSRLIERFAAPDYSKELTQAYNVNKGTDIDSVFNKRYFSDRSDGSDRTKDQAFDKDKNGAPFDASLKFDPGWNGYMPLSGDPRDAMKEDMAVMIAPTNAAMDAWFKADGKVILDYYKEVDSIPNSVIDDLLRVNQLVSLVNSVPSRFSDVLNDANEELGIRQSDVEKVTIGCNGVVYRTNKVFAPTSYSSVLFPAVIDADNFNIIENAISNLDYDKYLNSMVAKYIFLIPTNEGMLSYIDPVSYGTTNSQLWEFHYDASKAKDQRIYADVYNCVLDEATGKWIKDGERKYQVKNQSVKGNTAIRDRIENLLDNIIVTSAYVPGKKFYRTKGNQYVRVEGIQSEEKMGVGNSDKVYGSLQAEIGAPLNIKKTYEMSNGYALVLDGPVMGTRNTVAMSLLDHPEFSDFLGILENCGAIAAQNDKDKWVAATTKVDPATLNILGNLFNIKTYGDVGAEDKPASSSATKKATYLLNNYHYTVYAPTNEAMEKAHRMGLPTLQDLEDAELYDTEHEAEKSDSAARIKEVMLDFVKYHIQTNSVFVDGTDSVAEFESAKTELIPSITSDEDGNIFETGKYTAGTPYRIATHSSAAGMTVKDNMGSIHNVVTKDGLYNIMAEEYWISSASQPGQASGSTMTPSANPYTFYIDNASFVVVHAVDGALLYDAPKTEDDWYEKTGVRKGQFLYKYKPLTTEAKLRK